MSCEHCGRELPDRANFCPGCGAPVAGAATAAAASHGGGSRGRFEICEIRYWHGYLSSDFHAVALRPDGSSYQVARSPAFRWPRRREPTEAKRPLAAHRVLVARLVEDSWQLLHDKTLEHAGAWYALRFRRPLQPTLAEEVGLTGDDVDPSDADEASPDSELRA